MTTIPKSFHKIYRVKAVSRLLPTYFDPNIKAYYSTQDKVLNFTIENIDFSYLFWNEKLSIENIERALKNNKSIEKIEENINYEIDELIFQALPQVKKIMNEISVRLPKPNELWYSFRTLSHCSSIASRMEKGFKLHLSRGLVALEYNQYNIEEVLSYTESTRNTSLKKYFNKLANKYINTSNKNIYIFNIRNDGELHQILILCKLIKDQHPDSITILEASDANEQFDFSQWVKLFKEKASKLGNLLDYYLPRQDYQAGLKYLLQKICNEESIKEYEHLNIFPLKRNENNSNKKQVICSERINDKHQETIKEPVGVQFKQYISERPVFLAAGLRTVTARLSPSRCHWSACKFCTINSQHILPRGSENLDNKTLDYIFHLIECLKIKNIESLILMDEALPPIVLIEFAKILIEKGIKIVFRARARFTDDINASTALLLYKAGCRYLGMGLEAKSERVNLLVNKHSGETIDYQAIIDNLEKSGIRTHVYSIMAFPTETEEEIKETKDFLIENVKKQRYFTVSANTFYLMRGSGIAADPLSFNISKMSSEGDISLTFNFFETERSKNKVFADKCAQKIYQEIFAPHIDDALSAESFWHFVDHTGIFYLQKVMCRDNPFHLLTSSASSALREDFLEQTYSIVSTLRELKSLSNSSDKVYLDLATFNYIKIPQKYMPLILDFDERNTVRDNINRLFDFSDREESIFVFASLVQNGFFIQLRIANYINLMTNPFTENLKLVLENVK